MGKCSQDCRCRRHTRVVMPCPDGCTCGRHSYKGPGVTTYSGAHAQLNRLRGHASGHLCECGGAAAEWAYTHDDPCPNERLNANGQAYSTDVTRYKPMCHRCHRIYDKQHITECPSGHEYTPGNTLMDAGKRKCRTCVYARNRERRRRFPMTAEQKARKLELQRIRRAKECAA